MTSDIGIHFTKLANPNFYTVVLPVVKSLAYSPYKYLILLSILWMFICQSTRATEKVHQPSYHVFTGADHPCLNTSLLGENRGKQLQHPWDKMHSSLCRYTNAYIMLQTVAAMPPLIYWPCFFYWIVPSCQFKLVLDLSLSQIFRDNQPQQIEKQTLQVTWYVFVPSHFGHSLNCLPPKRNIPRVRRRYEPMTTRILSMDSRTDSRFSLSGNPLISLNSITANAISIARSTSANKIGSDKGCRMKFNEPSGPIKWTMNSEFQQLPNWQS